MDKFIKLVPNYPNAKFNRGYAYFMASNYPKALSDFENIKNYYSNNSDFLYLIGMSEYKLNSYQDGIAYLKKSAEMGNKNAVRFLNSIEN